MLFPRHPDTDLIFRGFSRPATLPGAFHTGGIHQYGFLDQKPKHHENFDGEYQAKTCKKSIGLISAARRLKQDALNRNGRST